MRISKSQLLTMIKTQAQLLEDKGQYVGAKAIEVATIQVELFIRAMTKNNLSIKNILERGN
jgi:hypothetical protein